MITAIDSYFKRDNSSRNNGIFRHTRIDIAEQQRQSRKIKYETNYRLHVIIDDVKDDIGELIKVKNTFNMLCDHTMCDLLTVYGFMLRFTHVLKHITNDNNEIDKFIEYLHTAKRIFRNDTAKEFIKVFLIKLRELRKIKTD